MKDDFPYPAQHTINGDINSPKGIIELLHKLQSFGGLFKDTKIKLEQARLDLEHEKNLIHSFNEHKNKLSDIEKKARKISDLLIDFCSDTGANYDCVRNVESFMTKQIENIKNHDIQEHQPSLDIGTLESYVRAFTIAEEIQSIVNVIKNTEESRCRPLVRSVRRNIKELIQTEQTIILGERYADIDSLKRDYKLLKIILSVTKGI